MGTLIHLRLDDNMLQSIDQILEQELFSNKTEFIRQAIRDKLQEYKREQLILKLKELQGSSKGFAPSVKQRKQFFEEFEHELTSSQDTLHESANQRSRKRSL